MLLIILSPFVGFRGSVWFGTAVVSLWQGPVTSLIGFQPMQASSESGSSEEEDHPLRSQSMPEKGLKRPRSAVQVKLKKVHPEGCYVCAVTRSTRFYHLPEDINDCGHLISGPACPDSMVGCRTCYDDQKQMRNHGFAGRRHDVRPSSHTSDRHGNDLFSLLFRCVCAVSVYESSDGGDRSEPRLPAR